MKRLRIGYVPYSSDLSHPGDRRRIVFWAKNRGHKIVTDLDQKIDVLLLSERADLGRISKTYAGVPVIFDLIDGYLSRQSLINDWSRGVSKVISGQLSGGLRPFSSFVKNLSAASNAVICSSQEQQEMISEYSDNVHIILDSHDEFPMRPFKHSIGTKPRTLLWEGMPATIGGLKALNTTFRELQVSVGFTLELVTDLNYFLLLGKYIKKDTDLLIRKNLKRNYPNANLTSWSVPNLLSVADKADAALIPINLDNSLQSLKPENRLLIMWRLGIPCLTSSSRSYSRVSRLADTDSSCENTTEWLLGLERVLSDDLYAAEMVRKGQHYLNTFHNSEVLLAKWDQAFESVL
jgi:hypothetical protein